MIAIQGILATLQGFAALREEGFSHISLVTCNTSAPYLGTTKFETKPAGSAVKQSFFPNYESIGNIGPVRHVRLKLCGLLAHVEAKLFRHPH